MLRRVGMPALAALATGGVLAAWAFTIILAPPGATADAGGSSLTATVVEGEVGTSLSLNAVAEWRTAPVGTNETAGIVTGVALQPGSEATQGTELYSVNGRPVVVARGEVPAYRPLAYGDVGADATQLVQMLGDLGFLPDGSGSGSGPGAGSGSGSGANSGSRIDAAAVSGIRAWQESRGETPTGEVALGDVVFVPSLPAQLSLQPTVRRGARLAGGEDVVLSLGAAPEFTIPAGENQAAQITSGARVEIDSESGTTWQAVVAGRAAAPSGSTVVIGLGPMPAPDPAVAPAPICGASCGSVPVTGQTLLTARIVIVETVRGAVVPSIALQTDAQQRLALVDERGESHPVTVLAAARGMSVVEGVEPGLVVRVPESRATLGMATTRSAASGEERL